ncbi:uncharacterized protein [Panulirus ornatus]|uniref:uncharacterized protein n=1 Tax=Panulirus ornatus TaxID=150431 RepID=UPI003A882D6B
MRQMEDKMTKGKLDILAKIPEKAVAKKNIKRNKKKNKALKNIGKNVGALVSDVSVVAPPTTRGSNSNADTASKNVQKESETEMKEVKKDPEQVVMESRTICVSNICGDTPCWHLAHIFRKYGKVEAARLRYPAIHEPKKGVTYLLDSIDSPETTRIGYIRFKTQDMANAALEADGMVYNGNYLRVEKAIPCLEAALKNTVFLRYLPPNTQEKDVRSHFANCGEIEHVRILRSKTSANCTGKGFVSFKSPDSIEFALQMSHWMFRGHWLEISPVTDTPMMFEEPQSKREVDKESPKKRLDIVKPKQKKARIENSIPAADSDFSKMEMIERKECEKDEKKTVNLKKSQSKKGMGKKSLKKGIDIVNPKKKKKASMKNSKPAADSDFSGMKMIETKKFKKLKKAKGKFSKEDKKKLAISQKLTGSKRKLADS